MRILPFVLAGCLLTAGAARAQSYDPSTRPIVLDEKELQLKVLEGMNRRLTKLEDSVFKPAAAKAPATKVVYVPPPLVPAHPQSHVEKLQYVLSGATPVVERAHPALDDVLARIDALRKNAGQPYRSPGVHLVPGQSVTIHCAGGSTTISVYYGR